MHSRTRGVRAALVALICALFFASPASPALEDALETSKMIVGEVRDYIRTVTTEGLAPLGREGVTAEGGPYPYLEGAENLEMRPCEEVCADKLLPGGGIAPPSLSPELLSQGFQACTTPCYYARTMMRAPSSGDLFQSGIEADLSFGQGRFTQAPYGLFTINFVSQHFYMYTPPRGTKPDEDCQNEGLPVGCPYQPGDVNPYGMRKIDMSSGKHLPPPIMEYAPLQVTWRVRRDPPIPIVYTAAGCGGMCTRTKARAGAVTGDERAGKIPWLNS